MKQSVKHNTIQNYRDGQIFPFRKPKYPAINFCKMSKGLFTSEYTFVCVYLKFIHCFIYL